MTVRPSETAIPAPIIALLGVLWSHAAVGDEIITANGDRLTGSIIAADVNRVLLKTAYAGIIQIKRSQVRSLSRGATQARRVMGNCPDAPAAPIADGSSPNEQDATAVFAAEPSTMPARAESPRSSPLTPGSELSGRINFALSNDQGNTDKSEVDFDYQVEYRHGWHRFRSLGALELDTNDSEKTTDKWASFIQYSRLFPSRWYGGAWLALEHDRFSDLRLRSVGGPVLGNLVFESDALNLAVEAGPAALQEDFYGQPDQGSAGGAWFLRYDQLVWQDRLQPYHRQFGYVALDGEDKVLWQSWTGLSVPLADGFTGAVEFEYDYDSNPAVEAKTTDTTVRVKLGYEW